MQVFTKNRKFLFTKKFHYFRSSEPLRQGENEKGIRQFNGQNMLRAILKVYIFTCKSSFLPYKAEKNMLGFENAAIIMWENIWSKTSTQLNVDWNRFRSFYPPLTFYLHILSLSLKIYVV